MDRERAEREAARERVVQATRPLSIAMNVAGVAALILLAVIRRGFVRLPTAAAFVPLGAVLALYAAIDLRTGVANAYSRGRVVLRAQEPRLFWYLVTAKLILAATTVWLAVGD